MLIAELPAAAKTIHRAGDTGVGIFYTVPDGQVLYVRSVWLVVTPDAANGSTSFGIGVNSEDTGAFTNLLVLAYPAGSTRPISLHANHLSQRANAGDQFSFLGTATGAVYTGGFTGFLI